MSKLIFRSALVLAPVALWAISAQAAPTKAKPTKKVAKPFVKKVAAKPAPLPQYVSLDTIERLRKVRTVTAAKPQNLPVLAPSLLAPSTSDRILKEPMQNLLTGPTVEAVAQIRPVASANGERLAQAFPRSIPPAAVPSRPRAERTLKPVVPKWVRYPLEFQLAGIGLGMRAVDKDRFNRIDRYGLFALHGNPTAVVVPAVGGGGVTVQQQPPEVAALFPGDQGGGLPDWAAAITVALDNNHVEWLYRRDTYSMGFVVDRLGFVDAIVVAGVQSNITRTQLEDPLHTVKLGDDFRKVMFRYGYPDTIETYSINVSAGVNTVTAGAAGAAGAEGAVPGAPGTAGAAQLRPRVETRANFQVAPPADGAATDAGAAGGADTAAFRTFEVRYEQSYNIVFTIRNNRVVRIYIFGDPDFFNERRRNLLRSQY